MIRPGAANASDKLPPNLSALSTALDTVGVDDDAALPVQAADGLLEVALADAEQAGDFLRRALVAQGQYAVMFFQGLHDQLLQLIGSIAAHRLQAQADLAVVAQF